jgi:hypothetical protein
MYWADELAERVSGPQVVNDSKTPSGTVHVGSLRGPVVHDVIARALRAREVMERPRSPREDLPSLAPEILHVALCATLRCEPRRGGHLQTPGSARAGP